MLIGYSGDIARLGRRNSRCAPAVGDVGYVNPPVDAAPVPVKRAVCETLGVQELRATVVFRWLAAGDAGDLDTFDDLLHPDAVIHAPVGLSTTSSEAEKAVWRDALAAMPDLRHDV